jgi:nitroimidazol reductase NimA-like FMN-containing flavoprotein (pyridoxamine 5'-phosphate oxidase superfamily)
MHNPQQTEQIIRELFAEQKVGVLATQADRHPYCNLIAFTPADDLQLLLFTTPRSTKKFRNLTSCPQVAFLVDNRLSAGVDFTAGVAVTALGQVAEAAPERRELLRSRHISRHERLAGFINDPDSVLLQLRVTTYIVVSGISRTTTLTLP